MMTRTLYSAILTASLAIAAPAAAMEMETLVSDTWKPGYTKDDGDKYVRHAIVQRPESGQVTVIERRDTSAPGYFNDGDGSYYRVVEAERPDPAQTASVETRDTWAPGFRNSDDGSYTRLIISPPKGGDVAEAGLPSFDNVD